MAGIDVGGGHGRRNLNHEIPLIPFIDFLLCLVAFLLVTAVWSQMARINADARVPGPPQPDEPKDPPKEKQLHVEMKGETKFQLVWKEGTTVVNTIDVEKKPVPVGEGGDIRYPDLAKKIVDEWNANGSHRAATDNKLDQAVLHTDNSTPFADVIAVIDAIYTPKREWSGGGKTEKMPAFNVTFSVN
jgi:biopolymer transport protein ExbD